MFTKVQSVDIKSGSQMSNPPRIMSNESERCELLNSSTAADWMFSDLNVAITLIACPIVFVVGLLGNGAFMLAIIQVHSMRTTTNAYLINLAIADTLLLFLVTTARLRTYIQYGVPNYGSMLGQAGCVIFNFLVWTTQITGMVLITIMSLERCVAVCHPLRLRLVSGRKLTTRLVVGCWLTGLVIAALKLPGVVVYRSFCIQWPDESSYGRYPSRVGRCDPVDSWGLKMKLAVQVAPFTAAFFGNAYFYARIVCGLNRRNARERQHVVRVRNQVAIMLVATGTAFFLTLTMLHITILITLFELVHGVQVIPEHVRGPLDEVNKLLILVNSAINPLVYAVFNPTYRKAFRETFTPREYSCFRRRRRGRSIRQRRRCSTGLSVLFNGETGERAENSSPIEGDGLGCQTAAHSIFNGCCNEEDVTREEQGTR